MAALLPVVAYNYWVFYRQPAFAFYTEAAYVFPTRADFAWALGPAAALALAARSPRGPIATFRHGPAGVARLHLAVWCAIAVVVFALRPVHFSLQFLVGVGLPLLALAAIGLGRLPVGFTIGAALALSSTAVAAVWLTLQPTLGAYAPAERLALAWELRRDCRAGDRLVAPADIGLWAGGFTACRAFTSHAIEPDHERAARGGPDVLRARRSRGTRRVPGAGLRDARGAARVTSGGALGRRARRPRAGGGGGRRGPAPRRLSHHFLLHVAMTPHLRIAAGWPSPRRRHHRPVRGRHPAPAVGRGLHGSVLLPGRLYQYLSFVEQASRGEVVFVNKFDFGRSVPSS